MKKGYYIYNPYSNKRDLVSASELSKITNLTSHELYYAVNNRVYLKNLGYILLSSTPESLFDKLKTTKIWTQLALPFPCNYEISNSGDIRKIHPNGSKGKILKTYLNKAENRYYVILTINKKRTLLYIDSAVVYHFFDGAQSPYSTIEYIDNDPSNLHCNNLKIIPNKIATDERWVKLNRKGSNYEISNYGRVRSILNFRYTYLKNTPKGKTGSLCVYLSLPNTRRFVATSRLVAEHFLPDFSEELYVSFKDRDNTNLYYKNLILFSKKDFRRRTLENTRAPRKVICINTISNTLLGPYRSAKEASKALGISYQAVYDNLNNKSKLTAKKYTFKYAE